MKQILRATLLLAVAMLIALAIGVQRIPRVDVPDQSQAAPVVPPPVTPAPVYDEAFMQSLLREPDREVFLRKVEEAGLIVNTIGSSAAGHTFYQIIDPTSGDVVMTQSVIVD